MDRKSDLEREMILADRHDRKQRRMETLQVRAEMRQQLAASKQQSRRTARAASSAQDDKKAKLAELALKRQQSEKRQKEKQKEREPSDDGSEDGETMADEQRRAAEKRERAAERARREKEEEAARQPQEGPAPFKNLERIRLTRSKLEKWINEPFFEKTVVGCLVRIGIGIQDGRATYRVAEITAVKDGFRQYSIEKVKTTKRIELQIGTSKRYFQINYCSNTNFELEELEKYGRLMRAAGLQTATMTYITETVKKLVDANNYNYTHEDVEAKIRRERETNKMKGNLALRKLQLKNEIEGHKQHVRELEMRILELERPAVGDEDEEKREKELEQKRAALPGLKELLAKTEEEFANHDKKEDLQKKIDQKGGSSFRITDINERNRKFQREVEEKVGYRDLQDQVEISAGRVTASDPFKRLPIRPVIYWDVSAKKEGAEEGESSAEAAPAPALTVDPAVAAAAAAEAAAASVDSPGIDALLETPRDGADAPTGAPALEAEDGPIPKLAGKRAQAHDIDLDLDLLDAEPAAAPPRARPLAGASTARSGDSSALAPTGQRLSLKDYKSRIEEHV